MLPQIFGLLAIVLAGGYFITKKNSDDSAEQLSGEEQRDAELGGGTSSVSSGQSTRRAMVYVPLMTILDTAYGKPGISFTDLEGYQARQFIGYDSVEDHSAYKKSASATPPLLTDMLTRFNMPVGSVPSRWTSFDSPTPSAAFLQKGRGSYLIDQYLEPEHAKLLKRLFGIGRLNTTYIIPWGGAQNGPGQSWVFVNNVDVAWFFERINEALSKQIDLVMQGAINRAMTDNERSFLRRGIKFGWVKYLGIGSYYDLKTKSVRTGLCCKSDVGRLNQMMLHATSFTTGDRDWTCSAVATGYIGLGSDGIYKDNDGLFRPLMAGLGGDWNSGIVKYTDIALSRRSEDGIGMVNSVGLAMDTNYGKEVVLGNEDQLLKACVIRDCVSGMGVATTDPLRDSLSAVNVLEVQGFSSYTDMLGRTIPGSSRGLAGYGGLGLNPEFRDLFLGV